MSITMRDAFENHAPICLLAAIIDFDNHGQCDDTLYELDREGLIECMADCDDADYSNLVTSYYLQFYK